MPVTDSASVQLRTYAVWNMDDCRTADVPICWCKGCIVISACTARVSTSLQAHMAIFDTSAIFVNTTQKSASGANPCLQP